MRIVCIGGGPAGLYFGLLMKKLHPAHHVTVVERNRPYDTFGWGVVFSDATMAIDAAVGPGDRGRNRGRLQPLGRHRGAVQGQAPAHHRPWLRRHRPQEAAQHPAGALRGARRRAGVRARGRSATTSFPMPTSSSRRTASTRRSATIYADVFKPDMMMRPNRFIWLGTNKRFDAFTFDFRTHRARLVPGAHLQVRRQTPRPSSSRPPRRRSGRTASTQLDQDQSIAFCENLFAEVLDGAKLMTNARHLRGSAWLNFSRLICGSWSHFNGKSHVVLMGDAAHTAHFAIGSGTKLAHRRRDRADPPVQDCSATTSDNIPGGARRL